MLQVLASNYSLNGCNLHYSYKKPFNILVEGAHSANWSATCDEFRTWLQTADPADLDDLTEGCAIETVHAATSGEAD